MKIIAGYIGNVPCLINEDGTAVSVDSIWEKDLALAEDCRIDNQRFLKGELGKLVSRGGIVGWKTGRDFASLNVLARSQVKFSVS